MSEETLQQVQSRLTRLLNHLPGMAYRCRVHGNHKYTLEFVSRAGESLLGLTQESISRHPSPNIIESMMPDEDRVRVRAVMYKCISARKPYEIYYQVRLESGEVKWVWDQGEGIFDENGICVCIEGILMDVTEQKNKEQNLLNENQNLRASIKISYGLGSMVGKSQAMQNVYSLLYKAAGSDTNVIIYGETGTGKDLAARIIHELSGLKGKYVPINCAAIPDQLLESEFFGHARGAFSGAVTSHAGYLASADGGTLFLDEVAELPLKLQVKLLRAIESKIFTPVGGSEPHHSHFRLISATNRDLQAMLQDQSLRADFFYRIHVLPIRLPPLRERLEDLPLLIEAYAKERGVSTPVPARLRQAMFRHEWPGNVRELQNVLDRFWAFGDTAITHEDDFTCPPGDLAPLPRSIPRAAAEASGSLHFAREEAEKERILAVLEALNWKKSESASALGVTLRTLQRKIKQYGLAR